MPPNPFLLAADNSPDLLPLLRSTPGLASSQDEHGYSLVHAAASYNHLDLLRALIREFHVDVNLRDEDNETALFVVENTAAAKVLVEELAADLDAKNDEGYTAYQKITEEGDFPEVAQFLGSLPGQSLAKSTSESNTAVNGNGAAPSVPEGLNVTVGTMDPAEENEAVADPELRRRIEELAQRDDFHSETGQAELRRLVEEALAGGGQDERNVRTRTE